MLYFQFHIGDWESGTRLMSPIEKGVYIELIVYYYSVERPITEDECKRIARGYANAEANALAYVLQNHFVREGDAYRHKKCDAVIAEFRDISQKRSRAARKSLEARRKAAQQDGDAASDVTNDSTSGTANAPASADATCLANEQLTISHKPKTNISTATPPVVPPHDEPELPMEAEAPKAEPKPDRAMVPFPSELPQQWLEDAKRVRTDIDPNAVFLKMKARFVSTTQRKTLGGWHKNWMTWIGREFPTNSAQRSGFAKSDKRFTVNQDEYYQNCMNPDGTVNYGI